MALSGDVRCLVQANNGTILAGVKGSAGIYKSTDDGVTWTHVISLGSVTTDTVRAFTKNSSGWIYAAVTAKSTNRGLWRSNDNGSNWVQIVSLSGGVTTIEDDGFWDIHFSGNYIASVLKDEHNGRNTVVYYLDNNETLYTLSDVNSSPLLDNRFPPYAIVRHPYRYGDNNYPIYSLLSTTNKFSTQNFEVSRLGAGTLLLKSPTSSIGTQSAADVGYRDLAEFSWWSTYSGGSALQHTTMLAAYRSVTPSGTEIWVAVDENPVAGTGQPPYTLTKIYTINDTVRGIYPDPSDIIAGSSPPYPAERTVWGAGNGNLWVSYNKGYTWELATAEPTNQLYAILRTSAGTIIAAGDSAEVFRYTGTGGPGGGDPGGGTEEPGGEEGGGGGTGSFIYNSATLGREATSTGFVGVTNKVALANVTYIYNYDTSAYTYLQFDQNPPYTLFDAAPDVGHSIYFGSRTDAIDVPGGPFSSLVFNLTQEAQGIPGYIWEYWNGSWVTLDVTDNTNGFSELGENSVHWRPPGDWATTAVNSITGYWVRVRITSVEASTTPPIHSNRFIYSINLPWVEINSSQIGGNVPGLMRIKWFNQGDNADSGTDPDLWIDRMVIGLRSVDRGNNFQSYLNASDKQNTFGITASVGTYSSFSDDITAPTTRKIGYSHSSPTTLDAFLDHAIWTIDNTIARDFYGTYRAFVRCHKTSGTSTTWKLRVKVAFGSEGIPTYSKDAWIVSTEEFEVLDLGRIRIPNTEVISALDNLGDELTISVQGFCTSESVQMYIYDLILVPTDEWAVDAIIPSTDTSLENGILGGESLDIDSITNQKTEISTYVRKASGLIKSNYRSIANGPSILQVEKTQRLWFFGMESRVTHWRAFPEIAGSVKINKVQRYSVMRGWQ